jgi:hypothetical protein
MDQVQIHGEMVTRHDAERMGGEERGEQSEDPSGM